MATPFESAQLNLQLFDLRREPMLREARAWFVTEFNPESFADLIAMVSGERNAAFRMVLGYWDMAASLVTTGAIDGDAFRAAHGEIFATFSKIQPYLAKLRSASGEPEFCKHMEVVVMAAPDAEAILKRRREAIRAGVKARPQKPDMAGGLDWAKCPAVESIPGKVSGAWVFRGTRVPVSAIFENLKTSPLEEVLENFHVTREQVQCVLDFAAKSTQALPAHCGPDENPPRRTKRK